MEEKTFSQILEEALTKHNLTKEKLVELSGIPAKYLYSIIEGNITKLPPTPYIRGYVRRLSETLEIENEDLWKIFQKETNLMIYEQKDKMPENRYSQKPIKKSLAVAGIVIVFLGIFLASRINHLVGKPNLVITFPDTTTLVFNSPTITLKGNVDTASKLLINNERVNIRDDGTWEENLILEPGLNSIEIKSQKLLGKELTIIKQIIYTPKDEVDSKNNF